MRRYCSTIKSSLGFVVFLAISPKLYALELFTTTTLSVEQTITDNVTLTPTDDNGLVSITNVQPGIAIRATGPSLTGNSHYRFNNFEYLGVDTPRRRSHQLDVFSNLDVIDRYLSITAIGGITQQLTTQDPNVPDRIISASTADRSDVYTASIQPQLRYQLGGLANAVLRYRHARQYFAAETIPDSKNSTTSVSVETGSFFSRIRGQGDVSITNTTTSNAVSLNTKTATGNGQFALNREIRLIGNLGISEYQYDVSPAPFRQRFIQWGTGFGWTPTSRTNIDATIGRFDSDTSYTFNLNHRFRRASFAARYDRTVVEDSGLRLQQSLEILQSGANVPVEGVPGQTAIPSAANRLSIRDHGEGIFNVLIGHRTNFSSRAYADRLRYITESGYERRVGSNGRLEYRFNRQMTSSIVADGSMRKNSLDGNTDYFLTADFTLTRRLSENLNANLLYRRTELRSTDSNRNYGNNQLIASIAGAW